MKYIKLYEDFLNEAVSVVTSKYKGVHGKEPKGFGMWAFEINGKEVFTPKAMNYGDAVNWAKNQAVADKVDTVYTLG